MLPMECDTECVGVVPRNADLCMDDGSNGHWSWKICLSPLYVSSRGTIVIESTSGEILLGIGM